jgi:cell division septum initiation protein DivIVA
MPHISKMNKKELYEHCKKLQEELNKEKLFNDDNKSLKEENEKLKEKIKTLKKYEDMSISSINSIKDKYLEQKKENKELINIIKSTKEFLEECCDKNDNGIYNHYETRQIATRIIDKNVGESYEEEISDLKEEIEDLEKDIKTWKKDYDKLIKEHLKENAILKKQLYVVDHETGEISDRTILQSYETPKFKEWRRENRNSRIQAEGSDDVSDLDLGKYIKTLETDTDWIKDLVFDNLCDICNPHDVCDADELTDDMIELIIQDIHSRFMDIRSLC